MKHQFAESLLNNGYILENAEQYNSKLELIKYEVLSEGFAELLKRIAEVSND